MKRICCVIISKRWLRIVQRKPIRQVPFRRHSRFPCGLFGLFMATQWTSRSGRASTVVIFTGNWATIIQRSDAYKYKDDQQARTFATFQGHRREDKRINSKCTVCGVHQARPRSECKVLRDYRLASPDHEMNQPVMFCVLTWLNEPAKALKAENWFDPQARVSRQGTFVPKPHRPRSRTPLPDLRATYQTPMPNLGIATTSMATVIASQTACMTVGYGTAAQNPHICNNR
ncbi:hypothetical protein K470DRAFT_104319 [Piedraia hortae CBS 480.64]|uniref:Uncharacterized protein n=1 Tax=Piedraia hortae CBS 480.64 TaxID=1314780 RepID=A0A6A7C7R5_9PEZI|nr:hypothetical protein K470DRAFT_104319 [Piedraia hortae CBS 480.64]